jgi:DNA-binding MarR family transcriptional regulator
MTDDEIFLRRKQYLRDKGFLAQFVPVLEGDPSYHQDWLIENFLPKGTLALIAGAPKSGKTCLSTAIALSVATGLPFAGHRTEQAAVLWISGEESPEERNEFLKTSPLVDTTLPLFTCYQRMNIDDEDVLLDLAEAAKATESKLIVVDPLLACITGRSLTDSWSARRTLHPLKAFCVETGLSVLVLHHQKRGEFETQRQGRVADNAQLAATSSMNIVLTSKKLNLEGTKRLITLECQGRGHWANRTHRLLSNDPLDYRPVTAGDENVGEEAPLNESERLVLRTLRRRPQVSEELLDNTGLAVGTVRNILTSLRRRGLVKVRVGEAKRRIYAAVRNRNKRQEIQELQE